MPSQALRNSLHDLFGDVAPKLVELTEAVVYDDIWERTQLSKRDRSMITVAALIALNRSEQLPAHLQRALDNGVHREELEEVITHMAIYGGFPPAITAARIAKEVFGARKPKKEGRKPVARKR